MRQWVAREGAGDRVLVRDDLPESHLQGAAIVANAVHDHARAARSALNRGLPVLVEKPLAPTAEEVGALIGLADQQRVFLGAAHVLLFAEYLRNFSAVLARQQPPTAVHIRWADVPGEHRHGEPKTVDAAVPVFLDVFPHVMSMLLMLWPGAAVEYVSLRMRAPESATVDLRVNGVPCVVDLSRAGARRTRSVEVAAGNGIVTLDFGIEPGEIGEAGRHYTADAGWAARPGPLASQLQAFLAGAVDERWDTRLSSALAYEIARLTDRMLADYNTVRTPA